MCSPLQCHLQEITGGHCFCLASMDCHDGRLPIFGGPSSNLISYSRWACRLTCKPSLAVFLLPPPWRSAFLLESSYCFGGSCWTCEKRPRFVGGSDFWQPAPQGGAPGTQTVMVATLALFGFLSLAACSPRGAPLGGLQAPRLP